MVLSLITWGWVAVGTVGTVLAAFLLREVLADREAAQTRTITRAQTMFLHETIRMTEARLGVMTLMTLAGLLPALSPLPERPLWVRLASLVLLIGALVLLTVDTGLRLRAKRRLLGQLRRELEEA